MNPPTVPTRRAPTRNLIWYFCDMIKGIKSRTVEVSSLGEGGERLLTCDEDKVSARNRPYGKSERGSYSAPLRPTYIGMYWLMSVTVFLSR